MASEKSDTGSDYWGTLIVNKTASPQFEQLCLGLAKVIGELEPGHDNELTPKRLSTFYRSVGGSFDDVLNLSNDAISLLYRTFGCFHSLQPTNNPFETPNIPCLTAIGFARWQTLQLLLYPQEHVPCIQKAAQIYSIPRPTGGYFPRSIPREAFPDTPDEDMEKWFKQVTARMNQDSYMRRIKNSPYASPFPEKNDRREGYFTNGNSGRRSSQMHRTRSQEDAERQAQYRRRSSVPDIATPTSGWSERDRGSHWDQIEQKPNSRSRSAEKRAHHNRQYPSPSVKQSYSPTSHRHDTHDLIKPSSRSASDAHHYRRPRVSSGRPRSATTNGEDTGSEASSENSQNGKSHNRKSDEERSSRKSSLWPPSFFKSHKRRHSSDAGYRPDPHNPSSSHPHLRSDPRHQKHHPQPLPAPQQQSPYRSTNAGVRFRDDMFQRERGSKQGPETPTSPADPRQPPPSIRYGDSWQQQQQQAYQDFRRDSSAGSGNERQQSEWDRMNSSRNPAGVPLRISNVTGVRGRVYPTSEPQNTLERSRSNRNSQIRGNVPTPV